MPEFIQLIYINCYIFALGLVVSTVCSGGLILGSLWGMVFASLCCCRSFIRIVGKSWVWGCSLPDADSPFSSGSCFCTDGGILDSRADKIIQNMCYSSQLHLPLSNISLNINHSNIIIKHAKFDFFHIKLFSYLGTIFNDNIYCYILSKHGN